MAAVVSAEVAVWVSVGIRRCKRVHRALSAETGRIG